ncbi:hypothetical protein Klosneuvirus_1_407 [Klosneuvirus KNV1]|uniref:Uncharacterized protein n=1 Tax=Klosneuvirus KNV1 TaxID=1977640 RepID=A0A1V0SIK3_9VIRU|nr:hypothetical protein Klosneuvirus_1_407 [Klosneuvirus KNV1]
MSAAQKLKAFNTYEGDVKAAKTPGAKLKAFNQYETTIKGLNKKPETTTGAPKPSGIPENCDPKGDTIKAVQDENTRLTGEVTALSGKTGDDALKLAGKLKSENIELYKRAVKLLIQELSKETPDKIKALKTTHNTIIEAMRKDKDLEPDLNKCLEDYLYKHYDGIAGGQSKGFFEELLGFAF